MTVGTESKCILNLTTLRLRGGGSCIRFFYNISRFSSYLALKHPTRVSNHPTRFGKLTTRASNHPTRVSKLATRVANHPTRVIKPTTRIKKNSTRVTKFITEMEKNSTGTATSTQLFSFTFTEYSVTSYYTLLTNFHLIVGRA